MTFPVNYPDAKALSGFEPKQSTLVASAGDQTTALNTFLASASPLGVKRLIGNFSVNGLVTVPANTNVEGSAATVTQTKNLSTTFLVNSNCSITGLSVVGVGTDYVNSSSVYNASGFALAGASSNVTFRNCKVTNIAGAGVYAASAPAKLRLIDCELVGMGAGIVPASGQWSGGLVLNNDGASEISVVGGAISGFAQGIVTGNLTDARISGVRIFNISGQHGIYFGSASRYVISGNLIDGTNLEGIKVQIGTTVSPDAVDGVISGNTISRCGSHGIHLAQTAGGAPRHRRVTITGTLMSALN